MSRRRLASRALPMLVLAGFGLGGMLAAVMASLLLWGAFMVRISPNWIGIALDARYSVATGLLAAGEDERILRLLKTLGFTLWHDALNHRNAQGRLAVLQGLTDFQEHLGGELTITLLAGIGRGVEVHKMDTHIVEQCIDWLEHGA